MASSAFSRSDSGSGASIPRQVVVIGAGCAGLATACLLAKAGVSVTVVDRIETFGGRAFSFEPESAPGFRWDAGPSWYLMPDAFDHFFELMGTSTEEQLHLKMLDPAYRLYPEGKDPVDVPHGRQAAIELFESIEPGAGARLDEYLESAASAYDIAVRRFLYTTFSSLKEIVTSEVVKDSPRLFKLLTESMQSFADRFVSDIRLQQILTYPAVFLSSEPSKAPSLYHLMSHADLTQGVRYPVGGFTSIMQAMYELALKHGVTFRFGAEAIGITTAETTSASRLQKPRDVLAGLPGPWGRARSPLATVTGVSIREGEKVHVLPADVVVSAADLHHTETSLLPRELRTYGEEYWGKKDPGPGTVLLYLGVRGRLDELSHHTLLFSEDWSDDFRIVYDRDSGGGLPRSQSIYISCPSKSDPDVAPDGYENLFVLVPVPADVSIGSGSAFSDNPDPLVEAIADATIAQIAEWAHIEDFASRIEYRFTAGPADFARRYNAFRGGAIGPAHTLGQSAFFRGTNQSARVEGLLYAGGTTVPGVGIPMCLISAENVLKRLTGDTTPDRLAAPIESSPGGGR